MSWHTAAVGRQGLSPQPRPLQIPAMRGHPSATRPLPSRRQIQLRALSVLAGAMVLAVTASTALLYRSAVDRTMRNLEQTATAVATLIETGFEAELARTGDSVATRAHAIGDLTLATTRFRDFGETGELVLGARRRDSIYFLLPERSAAGAVPAPITAGAGRSHQLQRAASGESGVSVGPDFRGVPVVGAYRYIRGLDVGLVAKIDVKEVRAPFVRASLLTALLTLVLLALGTRLQIAAVGPLLEQVFGRTTALEGDLRVADASTERYATLFRSAADPILIEDLHGTIIEANAASALVFGWSVDQLVGRKSTALFPDEDGARLAALRQAAADGDDVRDDPRVARTKDGERRHLLVSLAGLRDHTGSVVSVSLLAKDITALEEAKAALADRNASLEAEVRARTAALQRELTVARALASETRRGQDIPLIGDGPAIRALRERIVTHAKDHDALLLTGAAGAGQEAVARAIHARSDRATRPFLVLNCSRPVGLETPSDAGPDAPASLRTMAHAASGGTLYLDLVDQLSTEVQHELLRLIAEYQGADSIRLIAYSPLDPAAARESGRLVPELLSLLSRHRIGVPSLAERREDILPMALMLLDERARATGHPPMRFTDRARERLAQHDWPGNVRELEQTIEALVREAKGSEIDILDPLSARWRSIGGYRLVSPLGAGGMGEVWRAEHALLKRPAAVKLMRQRGERTPEERLQLDHRFRREAEVTSQLTSPHTVQLFDFGVTGDGEYYYVMELLSGLSLADVIAAEGRLSPARATYLLSQACLSLAEAHAAGLVHRDIKPDNLFVCDWQYSPDFVKVLDFGIVRRTDTEAGTVATKTGFVMGTPAYMAPEVARGDEASAAADLYSLGCVLYKMLTGRPVFETSSGGALQQLVSHMNEAPTPPSVHVPSLPAALDALTMRLLAKEPAERLPDAMALRDALAALQLDDTWTERQARTWWRNRSAPRDDEQTHMISR